MGLRAKLRSLRAESGGSVLVEFTLLAPVLIALMCGLAEFGQALRQYHVMEKGVRDAARYLAHIPAGLSCPRGGTDPAAWSTYVAQAQNLAVYGTISSSGATPLFKGWTSPGTVSVSVPSCFTTLRNNASNLPQVTVTASAPYNDLGMLSVLGLGPITLSVSHEELMVS